MITIIQIIIIIIICDRVNILFLLRYKRNTFELYKYVEG